MADIVRSEALAAFPHGFSTRDGLTARDVLPGAAIVRARQVHSPDALVVGVEWDEAPPPEVDALVTATPGLLLGIVTADCAPILLADEAAGVVGAAHAGWRGAQSGVIANTLEAMERLGAAPERVVAVIGPCIAQPSYEVDEALRRNFAPEDERYFAAGAPGHWQFDLPGFVAGRLERAGVERVTDLALDTYSQPDRFHSYRRSTHRGEPTDGRQLSVIGLPG